MRVSTSSSRGRLAVVSSLVAALVGCRAPAGNGVAEPPDGSRYIDPLAMDSGADADVSVDAGTDAGSAIDLGIDASLDAATEPDAGTDAGAGLDAGLDAGTSPVDAGLVCGGGFMNCGGTCTNVKSDWSNCGSCGYTCSTLVCQNFTCTDRCATGFKVCGHECVSAGTSCP